MVLTKHMVMCAKRVCSTQHQLGPACHNVFHHPGGAISAARTTSLDIVHQRYVNFPTHTMGIKGLIIWTIVSIQVILPAQCIGLYPLTTQWRNEGVTNLNA